MTIGMETKGLQELYRKMARAADPKVAHDTMKAYALLVEADVTPYPDKTEANFPPPPYYERGKGTVGVHKTRRTSENLHAKWKVKSTSGVILENTASYSGVVQGLAQTRLHASRGWKNAYRRANEMTGEIAAIYKRLFRKKWK